MAISDRTSRDPNFFQLTAGLVTLAGTYLEVDFKGCARGGKVATNSRKPPTKGPSQNPRHHMMLRPSNDLAHAESLTAARCARPHWRASLFIRFNA